MMAHGEPRPLVSGLVLHVDANPVLDPAWTDRLMQKIDEALREGTRKMATPRETAEKLVNGAFELVGANNIYRAETAGEVVDLLIGTDANALVRGIKGVPAELVEIISDGLKDAIVAQIIARLGPQVN